MVELVLASASPRRQELIQLLGLPVRIQVADVDESQITHPDPAANAVATARLKAAAVIQQLTQPAIVIGSDTIVAIDGEMLGKPLNADTARAMLRRLKGRVHQVHTGIVLIHTVTKAVVEDVATVNVPMRFYSEAEIEAYIATGNPLDKAGAYAIQHPAFNPVTCLGDCYAAVMGLPLCHLARALRQFSIISGVDVAAACQTHNNYVCPVYASILSN